MKRAFSTPDNCVITLIDHQPQMLFGVTSIDRQTLINNVVGFAKASKVFGVPTILTTVETKSFERESLAAPAGAVPRSDSNRAKQHELLG